MLKAILQKPPSVNHIYGFTCRGGFAHFYTKSEGTDWFNKNGVRLLEQLKLKQTIVNEIKIKIELYSARYQDIDNVLKVTFDILQRCIYCGKHRCSHYGLRAIKNDNQIKHLEMDYIKVKHLEDEKIVLEIELL